MPTAKPTFEQQLNELEKVVAQLESGELTLEENVKLFERGMVLSKACKIELESAESRIQLLLDPKSEGPVRTEDLKLEDDSGQIEEGADEE